MLSVLKSGGIAIAPCDTIYGIIGAVPAAQTRIRDVKGREETKPFLQLASSASWVESACPDPIPQSLLKYWPGPLTLVIRLRAGGTLAVRIPDSPQLVRLIARLGAPLYSTSVNRAGRPPLWRVAEIRAEFERDVDIIVDGGDMPGGMASTIVNVTRRPAVVTRQGGLVIPPEDLV